MLRWASVMGITATLAACMTAENVNTLGDSALNGAPFSQALAKEYHRFAAFERDEMYDWRDATYFADKGLDAAEGRKIQPETLDNWNIPERERPTLTQARNQLVQALNAGGRERHPSLAALAQAKFDCWVEQQEENHQAEHIASCRREFNAAMRELDNTMAFSIQAPDTSPGQDITDSEPTVSRLLDSERVFFAFSDAELGEGARRKVASVAQRIDDFDSVSVTVTGHADRVGTQEFNRRLSRKRAQNVRAALLSKGVANDTIELRAAGESDPAVATADGVREPKNRRVVIRLDAPTADNRSPDPSSGSKDAQGKTAGGAHYGPTDLTSAKNTTL